MTEGSFPVRLGGGGTTFSLSPEPEGYEVSLGACCCMTQIGSGLPYFYCMGYCGCGGCSSGDIFVANPMGTVPVDVGIVPLAFVLIKTSDVMVELSKFSDKWL